ncbi:MAG: hypothetical protein AB7T06_18860 [Kofleriaceae bacterium]
MQAKRAHVDRLTIAVDADRHLPLGEHQHELAEVTERPRNEHRASILSGLQERERLERTVAAIVADRYADHHAPAGWDYAERVDPAFIDGSIEPRAIRRRAASAYEPRPVGDLAGTAAAHLERLLAIRGVAELHASLEELVTIDESVTRDDGVEPSAVFANDARLNVVILGAGPIGLALASALRLAHANVLVLETRVASPHHKLPYQRRWLTAVDHRRLATTVEPALRDIFARVGTKHIGVTIDVLETLLLLSCRRMGVRFSFAEHPDLSFVGACPLHVVFDATGNRFRPTAESDVRFPLYQGRRVAQAMLKITQVPARLYEDLVDLVAPRNQDNKVYLWRGSLRDEINQCLPIVNLTRREYEALCDAHEFPLPLVEALASSHIDARTHALLARIAGGTDREVLIDAPFVWQPYLIERASTRLHGVPVVRVGDSIYNGNVKLANGLGPHLQHVAHIQHTMWTHATAAHSELVARAMGRPRT